MRIAVCIKPVPSPDSYAKVTIDPLTKTVNRGAAENVINPLDKHALTAALTLREQYQAEISVFAMAPPSGESCLREALAMGADRAYLLSDRAFGGSDSLATARILAAALDKAGGFELIICGAASADSGTSQVPAELAELLGYAHFHQVADIEPRAKGLRVGVLLDGLRQSWQCGWPLLLSVSRELNKPRYTTMRGIRLAQQKPLEWWTADSMSVDKQLIGLDGSPSKNGELFELQAGRACEKHSGDAERLAELLLQRLRQSGVSIAAKGSEGK